MAFSPMKPLVRDRSALVRRGQVLEYLTLASCSLEAAASIVAGVIAGSIALVGFGADSVIEVTSGAALLWRLYHDADPGRRRTAERTTLKTVGWCFLALAAYILFDSASSLVRHEAPQGSIPGIFVAVFSVITMPILARAKRAVARGIDSAAMNADATQTQLCSYLSAILLCGLLLNAVFGWWWADPLAALAMVPLILKEGREALKGRSCCSGAETCSRASP
jgi:divalent metal cation (Fe/Co/Zn/Cd) transporter